MSKKAIEDVEKEVEQTVAIFQRMDLEPWEQPPPLFLRTPSDEELAAHQDLVEWDGSSEDPNYNSPKYFFILFFIICLKILFSRVIPSPVPKVEVFDEPTYWFFSPSGGLFQIQRRKHQGVVGWFPIDRSRHQTRIPCEKVLQVNGFISMAYNLETDEKK